MYSIAALTFNSRECVGVFALARKAMDPKENSWRTISKASDMCCFYMPAQRGCGGRSHQRMLRLRPRHALM